MEQDVRERLVEASARATRQNKQIAKQDQEEREMRLLEDDPDKVEQINSSSKPLALVRQKTVLELKASKHGNESDVHITKDRALRNQEIIDYTQMWVNHIEAANCLQNMPSDNEKDLELAWDLNELLEKSISMWENNQ